MTIIEHLIVTTIWEFGVLSPDPNPERRKERYDELLLERLNERYIIENIETNKIDVKGFYDYLVAESNKLAGKTDKPTRAYFKKITSIMLDKFSVIKRGGFWLKAHSHQIADTGDYDGYYEITNGKISILTKDDDEEKLMPIVEALNDSECKFYQDDAIEFELKLLKEEKKRIGDAIRTLISETHSYDDISGLKLALEIFENGGITG